MAGVLTSFEIWDKSTWDAHTSWDKDAYEKVMEVIAGAGL